MHEMSCGITFELSIKHLLQAAEDFRAQDPGKLLLKTISISIYIVMDITK